MITNPTPDIPLIYDHEHSELFVRARSLHKWVVSLESDGLSPTSLREARLAGWRVLADVSMTGVARSARRRAVLTERTREQLAKCAAAIMALSDDNRITPDIAKAGRRMVDKVREQLGSLPAEILEVVVRDHSAEQRAAEAAVTGTKTPAPKGAALGSAPPEDAASPVAPPVVGGPAAQSEAVAAAQPTQGSRAAAHAGTVRRRRKKRRRR